MKKSTLLVVCILCVLMLVVGFAPSYVDFIKPPVALPAIAATEEAPLPDPVVEDVFLPPVATSDFSSAQEVSAMDCSKGICRECGCVCGCSISYAKQ